MSSYFKTTRDDFKRSFALATKVVSTTRKAVDRLDYSKLSERNRVARAFLTASLDHSSSLMHLYGSLESTHMLSAMALLRPQVETFSRGVFFASADACSEKEVEAFLEKDRLPRRPQPDGGKRTITLEQLFEIARVEILKVPGMGTPENKMNAKNLLRHGKGALHAPVHGGSSIAWWYSETAKGLYMCPPFDVIIVDVRYSAALAVFAHVFLSWRVCGLPEPLVDVEADAARAAFYADRA